MLANGEQKFCSRTDIIMRVKHQVTTFHEQRNAKEKIERKSKVVNVHKQEKIKSFVSVISLEDSTLKYE